MLIGRNKESEELVKYTQSGKAEFIAIYGRRRVGKTYLVSQLFKGKLAFSMSGIIDGETSEQMEAFVQALEFAGYKFSKIPTNWLKAFAELRKFLQPKVDSGEPCIVFLDEIPCLDTQRSGFIRALGHFWNSWASLQNNLKLIVCGSATTWMIKNIIDSKGGLHNRVTHEMPLHPFCLHEVEEYLNHSHFAWGRHTILQTYMVMGGIPYYLSLLQPQESLAENLDRLFFSQDAPLRREYQRLYKTLFNASEPYMKIVQTLASNKQGLTRQELAAKTKISGKTLTEKLNNLQNCDLTRHYYIKEKKIKKTGGIYQLIDFFSLFYLTFADKGLGDERYWTHHLLSPELNNWYGLCFERICITHIKQIKRALHLDAMATQTYSWRSKKSKDKGAQIDIIIDRADKMINVCEVKYCQGPYSLDKAEYEKLLNRMQTFAHETETKNGLYLTMITTEGLAEGKYANNIVSQIVLDDIFAL